MIEFDDEGYPPGSLGYEIRRIRAEAEELGDPDLIAVIDDARVAMDAIRNEKVRAWLADPR